MIGKLTGAVLEGTWYEIIYKNAETCPNLSYAGTFRFTLKNNTAFDGTWTDKNGKNSTCTDKEPMRWNGTRSS